MTTVLLRKLANDLSSSEMRFVGVGVFSMQEIYRAVKGRFPSMCDDELICNHDPNPHRPEWQHKVRSTLQTLRNKKLVGYDGYNRWRIY